MYNKIEIALTIFSTISVATCFILTLYFLFIKKENRLHDFSLGFLFLALAFRLSKSIIYYIFSDIDRLGIALGFLGFTTIGPLLLLYFKNSLEKYDTIKPIDFLHFLYPILGFVFILFISGYDGNLYLSGLLSLILYNCIIAIKFLFTKKHSQLITRWHFVLFYAMIGLIGSFAFQHWGDSIKTYVTGTAIAALIIYILLFYALRSPTLMKKVNVITPSQKQINRVVEAIEVNKVYKKPAITLIQFSKIVDIPPYIISKVTKDVYNKTFPETLNSFRIKEIKEKLINPKYAHYKIEGLAFDAGFNTSSAFYLAFKKVTKKTPKQYKNMILDNISDSN